MAFKEEQINKLHRRHTFNIPNKIINTICLKLSIGDLFWPRFHLQNCIAMLTDMEFKKKN